MKYLRSEEFDAGAAVDIQDVKALIDSAIGDGATKLVFMYSEHYDDVELQFARDKTPEEELKEEEAKKRRAKLAKEQRLKALKRQIEELSPDEKRELGL